MGASMTNQENERLEWMVDELEGFARRVEDIESRRKIFSLAWDLKQLARKGTPSEGV